MTPLIGTEKQVNWANEIRAQFIEKTEKSIAKIESLISGLDPEDCEDDYKNIQLSRNRVRWMRECQDASAIIRVKQQGWDGENDESVK